jgi:hypothetical protein
VACVTSAAAFIYCLSSTRYTTFGSSSHFKFQSDEDLCFEHCQTNAAEPSLSPESAASFMRNMRKLSSRTDFRLLSSGLIEKLEKVTRFSGPVC